MRKKVFIQNIINVAVFFWKCRDNYLFLQAEKEKNLILWTYYYLTR